MTSETSVSRVLPVRVSGRRRLPGRWLLLAGGIAAFGLIMAAYVIFIETHPAQRWLVPVDLMVYREGGEIALGRIPVLQHLAYPLYGWPGTGLKFTYPPFAALVFAILTIPVPLTLQFISLGVNIAALLATIWLTLGGLGYRISWSKLSLGWAKLGGTLVIASLVFWTEPVQRVLYLGQVELLLMALIMWDMCQPDRRWLKGAGVGIAAGIKIVPLVFIPYLLLTRRFRQAAVASGTFALTVIISAIVLPSDSRDCWLNGVCLKGSRTGFVGWEGNQSLQGLITRLAGSVAAGQPIWWVAALFVLALGLTAAVLIDRAGHQVIGLLTCALTGLLFSPVSWDHHWVWIVPAVTVLVVYGIRARLTLRWIYLCGAALLVAIFGAWPGFLWGQPLDLGGFWMGLIWAPPNTNPGTFQALGDRPWYAEYHWHGWELLAGNLYVLTGLALLLVVTGFAVASTWARGRQEQAGTPVAVSHAAVPSH
jgi:alpha-1,2-mannosyltransferase